MHRKNLFDNPIFVFLLSVFASLINILFSVHFISIMFAGVLFLAFVKALENRYFYSLIWIILAFLVVENIQGFRVFSLVALALFISIFIKPYIEHIIASTDFLKNLFVIIFYLSMIILYSFINGFDINLVITIVINIIIDLIIIGLFI